MSLISASVGTGWWTIDPNKLVATYGLSDAGPTVQITFVEPGGIVSC
jgi:hypothetical protein